MEDAVPSVHASGGIISFGGQLCSLDMTWRYLEFLSDKMPRQFACVRDMLQAPTRNVDALDSVLRKIETVLSIPRSAIFQQVCNACAKQMPQVEQHSQLINLEKVDATRQTTLQNGHHHQSVTTSDGLNQANAANSARTTGTYAELVAPSTAHQEDAQNKNIGISGDTINNDNAVSAELSAATPPLQAPDSEHFNLLSQGGGGLSQQIQRSRSMPNPHQSALNILQDTVPLRALTPNSLSAGHLHQSHDTSLVDQNVSFQRRQSFTRQSDQNFNRTLPQGYQHQVLLPQPHFTQKQNAQEPPQTEFHHLQLQRDFSQPREAQSSQPVSALPKPLVQHNSVNQQQLHSHCFSASLKSQQIQQQPTTPRQMQEQQAQQSSNKKPLQHKTEHAHSQQQSNQPQSQQENHEQQLRQETHGQQLRQEAHVQQLRQEAHIQQLRQEAHGQQLRKEAHEQSLQETHEQQIQSQQAQQRPHPQQLHQQAQQQLQQRGQQQQLQAYQQQMQQRAHQKQLQQAHQQMQQQQAQQQQAQQQQAQQQQAQQQQAQQQQAQQQQAQQQQAQQQQAHQQQQQAHQQQQAQKQQQAQQLQAQQQQQQAHQQQAQEQQIQQQAHQHRLQQQAHQHQLQQQAHHRQVQQQAHQQQIQQQPHQQAHQQQQQAQQQQQQQAHQQQRQQAHQQQQQQAHQQQQQAYQQQIQQQQQQQQQAHQQQIQQAHQQHIQQQQQAHQQQQQAHQQQQQAHQQQQQQAHQQQQQAHQQQIQQQQQAHQQQIHQQQQAHQQQIQQQQQAHQQQIQQQTHQQQQQAHQQQIQQQQAHQQQILQQTHQHQLQQQAHQNQLQQQAHQHQAQHQAHQQLQQQIHQQQWQQQTQELQMRQQQLQQLQQQTQRQQLQQIPQPPLQQQIQQPPLQQQIQQPPLQQQIQPSPIQQQFQQVHQQSLKQPVRQPISQSTQQQAPQQIPSQLPPQQIPSQLPPQQIPSQLPPQQIPSQLPPQQIPSQLPPQQIPSQLPPQQTADQQTLQHQQLQFQHLQQESQRQIQQQLQLQPQTQVQQQAQQQQKQFQYIQHLQQQLQQKPQTQVQPLQPVRKLTPDLALSQQRFLVYQQQQRLQAGQGGGKLDNISTITSPTVGNASSLQSQQRQSIAGTSDSPLLPPSSGLLSVSSPNPVATNMVHQQSNTQSQELSGGSSALRECQMQQPITASVPRALAQNAEPGLTVHQPSPTALHFDPQLVMLMMRHMHEIVASRGLAVQFRDEPNSAEALLLFLSQWITRLWAAAVEISFKRVDCPPNSLDPLVVSNVDHQINIEKFKAFRAADAARFNQLEGVRMSGRVHSSGPQVIPHSAMSSRFGSYNGIANTTPSNHLNSRKRSERRSKSFTGRDTSLNNDDTTSPQDESMTTAPGDSSLEALKDLGLGDSLFGGSGTGGGTVVEKGDIADTNMVCTGSGTVGNAPATLAALRQAMLAEAEIRVQEASAVRRKQGKLTREVAVEDLLTAIRTRPTAFPMPVALRSSILRFFYTALDTYPPEGETGVSTLIHSELLGWKSVVANRCIPKQRVYKGASDPITEGREAHRLKRRFVDLWTERRTSSSFASVGFRKRCDEISTTYPPNPVCREDNSRSRRKRLIAGTSGSVSTPTAKDMFGSSTDCSTTVDTFHNGLGLSSNKVIPSSYFGAPLSFVELQGQRLEQGSVLFGNPSISAAETSFGSQLRLGEPHRQPLVVAPHAGSGVMPGSRQHIFSPLRAQRNFLPQSNNHSTLINSNPFYPGPPQNRYGQDQQLFVNQRPSPQTPVNNVPLQISNSLITGASRVATTPQDSFRSPIRQIETSGQFV